MKKNPFKNETRSILDSAKEMVNASKGVMNDTRRLIDSTKKKIEVVQTKTNKTFRKR